MSCVLLCAGYSTELVISLTGASVFVGLLAYDLLLIWFGLFMGIVFLVFWISVMDYVCRLFCVCFLFMMIGSTVVL